MRFLYDAIAAFKVYVTLVGINKDYPLLAQLLYSSNLMLYISDGLEMLVHNKHMNRGAVQISDSDFQDGSRLPKIRKIM